MNVKCTCDLSAFQKGMAAKLRVSKQGETEITNRAARNVCLRAISFTPKAAAASIRALDVKVLAAAVATKLRVQGKKVSPQEFAQEIKRERTRRVRSVGYIAAGWIKAAQAFGAARNRKVSEKGNAAKGYGTKASGWGSAATGANLATGATIVGTPALQRALDFVGKDMLDYAQKKIAALWNK